MSLDEIAAINRLREFKPNPGFQERFLKSKARIRLIVAGNQSGKTTSAAADHAMVGLGEHPHKKIRVPNRGVIVTAKSYKDGIEDEIIPKLKEVCGSRDIRKFLKDKSGRPSTVEWRSGSFTHLMSAEQEDVAFESKTLDHVWIDEPVRRAIYIALLRGLMKAKGFMTISATPLAEPWMYDEIYLPGITGQDKEIAVFEGSSDENIHISDEARDSFFKRLTPEEVQARRYGKFRHLSGRVINHYDWAKHRIEPFNIPNHWPVYLSIDPHRNKPHAATFLTVSPQNKKYICNEVWLRDTIKAFGFVLLDLMQQYNMVSAVIDSSAQETDWGRTSARDILDEVGIRTKVAQKMNMKTAGILQMNQLFHDDQLFVFNTCHRTHKELMLWTYRQNKRDTQKVLEEPEKKFDDMLDTIRYTLTENPTYSGLSKPISYTNYSPEEDFDA